MSEHATVVCSECGETRPHHGHGLCRACYSRARRTDPDHAARDREHSRSWKARNRARVRVYDRQYAERPEVRGTCTRCGELMGASARSGADGLCMACRHKVVHERSLAICLMWRDGLLLREIAAKFEWSMNRMGSEMCRMRAAGYNLPRRYELKQRATA